MNTPEFSDAFINAAMSHGEGSETGNSKLTNKSYDKLIDIIRKYRSIHGSEKELVLPLLSHQNSSVCTWAALFSLPIDEARAMQTLTSISEKSGIVSFSAKMTLEEWLKGALKIPK